MTPPLPDDTAWGFSTPSRNIVCGFEPNFVRCDISLHTWKAPPRPSDCPADFGSTLVLDESAQAKFICVSDAIAGVSSFTAASGATVRRGSLNCDVLEAAVTCREAKNGHGFFLSKATYRRF